MNEVCDIRWSLESNQQGLELNSKLNREPVKRGSQFLVPADILAATFLVRHFSPVFFKQMAI